ncbi:MAG: 30S ribosome-binding factor RbfA [Acutalibacteraceae bacterium]|nr:30S ribosome-binding factor RbfA [Acutalibacteraceae bacterium]
MSGHKIERIQSDITFQLSNIIPTLKDPRISGLLSIVRVEVTNDLSYAKVYVGSLEGLEQAKKAVKGLTNASGYIRRELSSKLKLRKTPELRFIADNSIEHSASISKMIDDFSSDGDNEND